jgi:D-glycero-alpha-D-manno-heptose-7-phosphate kinase
MLLKIPLRISFVGGGTDFPEHFDKYKGASISLTFNKFVYITNEPERFNGVHEYDDLVKAAQTFYDDTTNVRIASDIPPGSGLGTSSAIAVGLAKIYAPYYRQHDAEYLAETAIEIERVIADIPGGLQDQYIAAYPGCSLVRYSKDKITIEKHDKIGLILTPHLLLLDTGINRRQQGLMTEQIERTETDKNIAQLMRIQQHTERFIASWLDENKNRLLRTLGKILIDSWEIKKQLATGISNPDIDKQIQQIKELPKEAEVYGSKLMGAGGGGYILLICKDREATRLELTAKGNRIIVPEFVDSHEVIMP